MLPLGLAPEASASLLGYALRKSGRASGYRALYSCLEGRCVSINTYARWNPVLESHQPLRLCRPPLELLGQRDVKFEVRTEAFASARID